MATIPVYSPMVPFLGLIPGGIRHGSMVRIKGIINNHGERCQINIQTGAALNPRDDVTLHISIRPNEAVIVRNTLQNQVWGAEERYGGCPINYGQSFDVLVLVEVNQYKIAINGTHFCVFNHRQSVHSARYVSISGSCVIHSITTEMDTTGSSGPPYPGTASVHPPPYTPPSYPPYSSGSHIGFVPVAPPMPPPPPYTPTPGYPIGNTGSYPGAPPHIPPYGGYPHQPGYPAATPYSPPQPTAPSSSMTSTIQANPTAPVSQPKTVKDSVITGVQQTKNFLHDAIYGKTTTAPSYPQQPPMQHVPISQPAYPPQTVAYPSQQTYGAYYPSAPYPPLPTGPQHYNSPQKPSGGLLSSGAGIATAALAFGAAAAVLHKLPKKAKKSKKSKKLMKYAAGAGVLGLGGYAIGKGLRRRGSSSSSSSSSSSDSD
ncbi:galectin-9-like [Ochlerotatus camptorhynchus]|uniref:galectin-9-like n=1 Tax=Ochlerotatus camptorhynchus TaxID=644619 RepID=UPI0031DEB4C8